MCKASAASSSSLRAVPAQVISSAEYPSFIRVWQCQACCCWQAPWQRGGGWCSSSSYLCGLGCRCELEAKPKKSFKHHFGSNIILGSLVLALHLSWWVVLWEGLWVLLWENLWELLLDICALEITLPFWPGSWKLMAYLSPLDEPIIETCDKTRQAHFGPISFSLLSAQKTGKAASSSQRAQRVMEVECCVGLFRPCYSNLPGCWKRRPSIPG